MHCIWIVLEGPFLRMKKAFAESRLTVYGFPQKHEGPFCKAQLFEESRLSAYGLFSSGSILLIKTTVYRMRIVQND